MRAYSYIAYDNDGRRTSGTVLADTETHAADQLKSQGLFATDLTVRADKKAGGFRRHRLNADMRMVFTRQMAVLLSADLPAEQALEALRVSGGGAALEGLAAQAKAALMDGLPLSDALEQSGAGFPPYYFAALRAGETSGDAAAVFAELADHLEQSGSDKAQIATALVYPAFVAAVSLVVCAILMTSVAPEIISMFDISGRPLPELTQYVLAVGGWLQRNVGIYGPILIGGGIGFLFALRLPPIRNTWDNILLSLPLIGRLMRQASAAQYMRTLALVIGSKQAVADAVDNAAGVLTVRRFADQAAQVGLAVRHGETLSEALMRLTIIPPVARQLISAGEQSARLAPMMGRAAVLVENQLTQTRKRVAALMEPALMILVGAFVLIVVLAVLLPIFDLQSIVAI